MKFLKFFFKFQIALGEIRSTFTTENITDHNDLKIAFTLFDCAWLFLIGGEVTVFFFSFLSRTNCGSSRFKRKNVHDQNVKYFISSIFNILYLGFDPRRGSKFSFEKFQPRGQEDWRCKLSNRQIVHHSPGLNSKPFRSIYVEKAQLLIAIRPSDRDVKSGGPFGAFREERAMSRYRVLPSPFLSSSSHTTQLHYTNSYTYSHPNLNFLMYTIQILTPHVIWSAEAGA